MFFENRRHSDNMRPKNTHSKKIGALEIKMYLFICDGFWTCEVMKTHPLSSNAGFNDGSATQQMGDCGQMGLSFLIYIMEIKIFSVN